MADPSGATSLSCSRPKNAGPWLRCTDSAVAAAASVRTAVCSAPATWEVRLPGSRVAGCGPSGPGRQDSTIARTNSAACTARSRTRAAGPHGAGPIALSRSQPAVAASNPGVSWPSRGSRGAP